VPSKLDRRKIAADLRKLASRAAFEHAVFADLVIYEQHALCFRVRFITYDAQWESNVRLDVEMFEAVGSAHTANQLAKQELDDAARKCTQVPA
jgi:hypothetical protein